MLFSLTV